jgi:hypothetical protein
MECFYIIGGFDGKLSVNHVERYDKVAKTMQEMCSMKLKMCGHGACVVSGLPNAKSYSWQGRQIEEEASTAKK